MYLWPLRPSFFVSEIPLFFYKPVYRKWNIPCRNEKLPDNHNTADQSAGYDIDSKYSHRCSKVMVYRNQPQKHSSDTERNAAKQSYIKIVCFSVLRKDAFSPIKEKCCQQNRHYYFLKKIFPYFSARHSISSFSSGNCFLSSILCISRFFS